MSEKDKLINENTNQNEGKLYEKNIKVYKKYKMFSYDFLFYFAVSVMYFTQIKGFTTSQVMYITAFYTFFSFIWQVTANFLVEKIGLKKSIVFGNFLVCFTSFSYIVAPSFYLVIVGEFFGSLGFTLKSLAEGTLCYSSLKRIGKRESFSKVEGIANSKYYYYDAISSVLAGYLFIIDGYIPIILCFVNSVISLMISLNFKDIKLNENENLENKFNFKEFKCQLLTILKSKRSKSIFLYAFFFMGIISVTGNLYKLLLIDLGIQTQYITMIVCLFTVLVGFGAKFVFALEKRTKNKTLMSFAYMYIFALAIISITCKNFKLSIGVLIIVMLSLSILGFVQGAYRVAIKKYVLNFTNSGIRTKITSLYYMAENLGSSLMLFISGKALDYMPTYNFSLIFTIFSFITMGLILVYMKGKIGLKPEEYKSSEINNTKL